MLLLKTQNRDYGERSFYWKKLVCAFGCWLNNISLFWQITTHWNSRYIELNRMKKFIFFDIVSLTLCLESLILQQGADSSMVEGKQQKFGTILKYSEMFNLLYYLLLRIILYFHHRRISRYANILFLLRKSLGTFWESSQERPWIFTVTFKWKHKW